MTHTLEITNTVLNGKDIARRISELIAGEDVSATMVAMTFIIGSLGAAFYEDEDKDEFMNRVLFSVSESYDAYMEDHDG